MTAGVVPYIEQALRRDRWQIPINKRWTRAGCRYLWRSYVGENLSFCLWPHMRTASAFLCYQNGYYPFLVLPCAWGLG